MSLDNEVLVKVWQSCGSELVVLQAESLCSAAQFCFACSVLIVLYETTHVMRGVKLNRKKSIIVIEVR